MAVAGLRQLKLQNNIQCIRRYARYIERCDYFEGTRFHNLVDNNVIADIGALLYKDKAKELWLNNWQTMDKRGEKATVYIR